MDTEQAAQRVRREIIRLCHAGSDARTLQRGVIGALRKVMPIDVCYFATADPATLLFTGTVVDEAAESHAHFTPGGELYAGRRGGCFRFRPEPAQKRSHHPG